VKITRVKPKKVKRLRVKIGIREGRIWEGEQRIYH
jgi:hypothetical protein